MKLMARVLFGTTGMAFALATSAQPADYPNKPVRIVYPFAAGGGGDLV